MSDTSATDEAALLRMCRQVLRNHCTTHGLSLQGALSGCGLVLAGVCTQWVSVGGSVETILADTGAALRQALRSRQLDPPLQPFSEPEGEDPLDDAVVVTQAQGVWYALAALLNDAGVEWHVSGEAGWRIAVALTADVLAMLLHDYWQDLEEVEALIEGPLASALAHSVALQGAWGRPAVDRGSPGGSRGSGGRSFQR